MTVRGTLPFDTFDCKNNCRKLDHKNIWNPSPPSFQLCLKYQILPSSSSRVLLAKILAFPCFYYWQLDLFFTVSQKLLGFWLSSTLGWGWGAGFWLDDCWWPWWQWVVGGGTGVQLVLGSQLPPFRLTLSPRLHHKASLSTSMPLHWTSCTSLTPACSDSATVACCALPLSLSLPSHQMQFANAVKSDWRSALLCGTVCTRPEWMKQVRQLVHSVTNKVDCFQTPFSSCCQLILSPILSGEAEFWRKLKSS